MPSAADWIAVDILDDKGVPRRVAVAHEDPAKVALAAELAERYPSDPNAPRGKPYVLRTGQRDADANVTDELFEAAAHDPEHLEVIRSLGIRSWLCVPILAGEQVLGAISFVADEPDRFGPEQVAFAENLAARIALAISTSRSYREAVRSKNVLDATLDAVIVFDPVSLRISYVNDGAMDQLGYAEADLVGAEATTVIDELDSIGLRGLVEPLVNGSLDARTATLTFRHSDGRTVPVEALLQHVVPAGEAGPDRCGGPRRRRADGGPGEPPPPGRVGARPGGRAQRRDQGDRRRHLRLRAGRADQPGESRGRGAVPRCRGGDLRGHPRSSSTIPTVTPLRWARSAARSSCGPAARTSAGSSSAPIPSRATTRSDGDGTAARRPS